MGKAVVFPLGVPDAARGLGLGAASLIHRAASFDDEPVGLARLHGVTASMATQTPLEMFVPPTAWREVNGGHVPADVELVITGTLEPPDAGVGALRLAAFDARTTAWAADVEAVLDTHDAGRVFGHALRRVLGSRGAGRIVEEFETLDWETLTAIFHGERLTLQRDDAEGPSPSYGALLHLERAVAAAPHATLVTQALARFALAVGRNPRMGEPLRDAALRTLERARTDAPEDGELALALAVLLLHRGAPSPVEGVVRDVERLLRGDDRCRALRAELLRRQRRFDEALRALEEVSPEGASRLDVQLVRGRTLEEAGRTMDARRVFEAVFEAHPLEWPAFDALSRIARATNDEHLAAWLVDRTLSVAADVAVPHAEAALGLMMKFESEGPARDARVHALASALAAREERADWAHLLLARATLAAGDQERAAQLFERVHREATTAGVAAEAAREVLEATDPDAASEVRSVLRSAQSAPVSALGSVLTHARRLATTQDVWPAHLAVAVAARRLGAWDTAKDAHARLARLIPDHPALNDEAIALREALSGEGSQGGPLVGVTTPPRPGASRRK